ncbi:MAG TPA: AhpC/TSA family protein [Solirubrobacteraceae bacterium]
MQLHDHRDRFDGRLWLVGMGTPAHARAFKDETGVTFPVLVSPDKAAYKAMDLRRGSTRDVFSPRALGVTLGRLRHTPLRAPEQDWHQLGGTFVIAPGGEVVFAHRADHPADEPDIDAVAAALQ